MRRRSVILRRRRRRSEHGVAGRGAAWLAATDGAAAGGGEAADLEAAEALRAAAAAGSAAVVAALVRVGADVDGLVSRRERGVTPLMAAAQGGHVEAVATLLAADAAINLATPAQAAAVHLAAGGGQPAASRCSSAPAPPSTRATSTSGAPPPRLAARALALLLSAGEEAGGHDRDGHRVLGSLRGHADVAALLLGAGARQRRPPAARPPRAIWNMWSTPLHLSVSTDGGGGGDDGRCALVGLLLEHGADASAVDERGRAAALCGGGGRADVARCCPTLSGDADGEGTGGAGGAEATVAVAAAPTDP